MEKIDTFIEKHYNKIKEHFYCEAKELGYKRNQLKYYFDNCKCFVFVGTLEELKSEFKHQDDYYIIVQEEDMIIAETFNGVNYNFI